MYNVGSDHGNYQILDIADHARTALDRDLGIVYLENEHLGTSYDVNFESLAATGFELEWGLDDGIVHSLTDSGKLTATQDI